MSVQDELYPILSISLVLEEESVRFKETPETIKGELKKLLLEIVASFDSFMHPKACRVTSSSSSSQGHVGVDNARSAFAFLTSDDMVDGKCKNKYDEFYKQFCSAVSVSEKLPKIGQNNKSVEDENIMTNPANQRKEV